MVDESSWILYIGETVIKGGCLLLFGRHFCAIASSFGNGAIKVSVLRVGSLQVILCMDKFVLDTYK